MSLKATSEFWSNPQDLSLYEILKCENSELPATIRFIAGKLGSLSHLVLKELSDGYKTQCI